MLRSEFRSKYPLNPDEGDSKLSYDLCNYFNAENDPNSKYYRPNLKSITEFRLEYCLLNNIEYELYMHDWRSIKRINPVTKQFYKSKKIQVNLN